MIPFFMERLIGGIGDRKIAADTLKQFKLIYYDTAVESRASILRLAFDVLGTERIIFGTDVPYGPDSGNDRLRNCPKIIKSLGLPDKTVNAILANNILRIIKIN